MIIIPDKTGKYVACEYCGKIVYKTLSQYNKREHHFCSNKCQSLLKREQSYEYRKCDICGTEFYVSKKSTKRFCSQKCQNEWQRTNTCFKNPKFEGKSVTCEYCGKTYELGKYRLENAKHHFCSSDCRKKWYSEVWSQTDTWKDESRKRAVRILSKNKTITMTKPQVGVNEMLYELGVSFINEESFVYYSVDNYLPEYNLIIEVMGDYWHTSPIKYNFPKNDKQKHVISRDKAKHTYIKNQYDIEILYIWEYDILNNRAVCSKLITEYINNNGKLMNYHSFNYSIDKDNNLQLNEDIIVAHQDRQIAC